MVSVNTLVPGLSRRQLNRERLKELAESIREIGVKEPPLVREIERNKFQLIDGEHRWTAAKMAGLQEIPVLVTDVPDKATMQQSDRAARLVSIVVNYLRENYPSSLVERKVVELWESKEFGTQEELGRTLGKSQSWVSEQISVDRYRKVEKLPDETSHETVRQIMYADPDRQSELVESARGGNLSSYEARKQGTPKSDKSESDQLETLQQHMLERSSSRKIAEPIRWNWRLHNDLKRTLDRNAECPVCGSHALGWLCHDKLTLENAIARLKVRVDAAEHHVGNGGKRVGGRKIGATHRN